MCIIHNLKVKVWINFSLVKSQSHQITVNTIIPGSWSFLESIQGLIQLANMRFLSLFLKALRLLYVTSSPITPLRNTIFTSIWCNFHPHETTREMMDPIEVYLTTGAKVSS